MGLENFNPAIWSAKLFVRLRKSLVYAALVNQDYEGEISEFGDSVRINEISPITISDYTKYGALTWQALTSAQKILLIYQAKSFSFAVDDIDVAQQKPKVMNGAMSEAAYAISNTIDSFIAGLYGDAGITNSTYLGTAASGVSTSSGNVIERLSYVARYMDEADVPREGRFAVVPPWFHQKLVLAEVGGIASTAVPKVFDDGVLMNGWAGQAMGFNVILSNNAVTVSTSMSAIMAFNRSAISYAGQISKVKAVEREDYFDQGVKGLYLYGGKVVRPNALATLYATEAAG